MILTKQQVDEIEARAEKATAGSWEGFDNPIDEQWALTYHPDDAIFIAAARIDVPALCATIRELKELLSCVTGIQSKGLHNDWDFATRTQKVEEALK